MTARAHLILVLAFFAVALGVYGAALHQTLAHVVAQLGLAS